MYAGQTNCYKMTKIFLYVNLVCEFWKHWKFIVECFCFCIKITIADETKYSVFASKERFGSLWANENWKIILLLQSESPLEITNFTPLLLVQNILLIVLKIFIYLCIIYWAKDAWTSLYIEGNERLFHVNKTENNSKSMM